MAEVPIKPLVVRNLDTGDPKLDAAIARLLRQVEEHGPHGGSGNPWTRFIPGRYYATPFVEIVNYTPGFEEAGYVPFPVDKEATFDLIGCSILTAGGANSQTRLGVYDDTGNGHPGSLVSGSERTIDSSTSGTKFTALSITLPVGLYWLVAIPQVNSTVPTYKGNQDSTVSMSWPGVGIDFESFALNGGAIAVGYDSITGALPASYVEGDLSYAGSAVRVGLRAA